MGNVGFITLSTFIKHKPDDDKYNHSAYTAAA